MKGAQKIVLMSKADLVMGLCLLGGYVGVSGFCGLCEVGGFCGKGGCCWSAY